MRNMPINSLFVLLLVVPFGCIGDNPSFDDGIHATVFSCVGGIWQLGSELVYREVYGGRVLVREDKALVLPDAWKWECDLENLVCRVK